MLETSIKNRDIAHHGRASIYIHTHYTAQQRPKWFAFHELESTSRLIVRFREFKGNNHVPSAPKATLTDDDNYEDGDAEPRPPATRRRRGDGDLRTSLKSCLAKQSSFSFHGQPTSQTPRRGRPCLEVDI